MTVTEALGHLLTARKRPRAATWVQSPSAGILADAALVPDAGKLAAGLAGPVRNYCRVTT